MSIKKEGLVLVELIVALVVMGILFTAAYIRLSYNEEARLKTALNELVNDLRYTQRLALASSTDVRLELNVLNKSYTIRRKEEFRHTSGSLAVRWMTDKTVELSNVNRLRTTLPGNSYISYTSRGTTGDACSIILETDNYTGTITVNVGSGRVKITEIKRK